MSEHRHTLIVKNHFQHRIILQTVLLSFIALNLFITLSYVLPDYLGAFADPDVALAAIIAVLELFALGGIYLISRRLSFRIAGPIYALERNIKRFADGDLNIHVALRKDDYFMEVSDVVNEAVDHFHGQIEGAKASAERLRELIEAEHPASPHADELLRYLAYFETENTQTRGEE